MLNQSELKSKIAGIKKSANSIRANVQTVACNIAGHAYEHGDVTLYAKLYDAMGGLNKKKFVQWVHEFGFARLQKDGSFKLDKKARESAEFTSGDEVVEYLTTEVRAWYENEETAEQILKALDVEARINSLAKQIASGQYDVKVDNTGIDVAIANLNNAIKEAA